MVKNNISNIKERIALICPRINREPKSVTIVAIIKGRSLEEIEAVAQAGIVDIGENRVQEALAKYSTMRPEVENSLFHWHMVGHLQTNKVKLAVKIFDLIHSVDSLALAEEINKESAKVNKVQDILFQVNISGEATKFGFSDQEVMEAIPEIGKLKNINLKGLMAIAPLVAEPEKARPYFRILRELRDRINQLTNRQLTILSMGMTDDFEVAVEEGSNMLRLGRAIFEE